MTALAGAFSSSSLFHQAHAADWEAASHSVSHLGATEAAQNEDYWSVIQRGYSVSPQIINLNNGGVSPAPIVVQQAVERYNQMTNEGPSYFMWQILDQGREPLRQKLARLAGTSAEEIAINRNSTEALNTVIFGLPLKAGDEVIGTKQDYNEILGDLGKRYEAALNTYKPFACGIVMHPAIDAAIQLRDENKLTADQVERVDLKVHPLVLELTGKKNIHEGLEGKFSIYHAVAVALVEGAGGEKQFSDRAVNDPTITALRAKVNPVVTPGIDAAQVDMTVVLKDGRQLHRYIEHAIGSVEKPMTDQQLETKFTDLAEGIIPQPMIRRVMDACWNVESLPNAAEIAKMSVSA